MKYLTIKYQKMKATTFILTLLLSSPLISHGIYARGGKFEEIKIKTSSQCDMCEERIGEALAFEKGVKKFDLDLETQIITVSYKKGKTSPDQIRTAISKAGYDADDVKADLKAYGKLPACCKKPEDPAHEGH